MKPEILAVGLQRLRGFEAIFCNLKPKTISY